MEVWLVSYRRPVNPTSGFDRAVWSLASYFSKKSIKTHVVYRGSSEKLEKETVNGIKLYGIPTNENFFKKNLDYRNNTIKLLERDLNKKTKNVFILSGAFALPLAKSLRSVDAPMFISYYTFDTAIEEYKSTFFEILRVMHIRKARMYVAGIITELSYLKYVDSVIVPHRLAAERFRNTYHFGKGIFVLPYGQDIYSRFHGNEFFKNVEKIRFSYKRRKIILFIGGRAWDRKGARYIVKAYSRIYKKIPSVLIMTGVVDEKIVDLGRSIGLVFGKDVITTGLIEDKYFAQLLAACDIFTHPSLHEGFSQPVIEVMAYGKPVVVSESAGYPTVINNREGFIIAPQNADSYAYHLEKLLTDKRLYDALSKNARAKASDYEWNKIGLKLLTYLKKNI